jgi:5-formyltetrahydrofolate cyclo-ligase
MRGEWLVRRTDTTVTELRTAFPPVRVGHCGTQYNGVEKKATMPEPEKTPWSGYHPCKDRLRSAVWTRLKTQGAAIGEPLGHIPRFVGSDLAAMRLGTLPAWRQATVIKCNPDAAQTPVRRKALEDGKVLYMAVPRLTQERCFVQVTAAEMSRQGIALDVAATNRGAMQHGRLVAWEEMRPVDLVVVGCVAVSRDGGRTGKGAGFADLELGMLRQQGLVQAETPVVTTVHPLQIVDSGALPMLAHDWSLTWIITPDEAIATQSRRPQPAGLLWESIRPEQCETIPALRALRQ